MWTNVFRIGGLHHISWFQLLPSESDSGSFIEKSAKNEQRDAATFLVLSSHVQLQNEGFLSTWTNSFVGPWDPSQGVHNPDEKIKLWLFLPGRHSTIVEVAQPAVSKLRVVATGLWSAPGDSEEVAVALSQALRNRIERTLRGIFYVRFGDVFSKIHSSAQNDRRVFPTCEFVFAATEDAIFVHAVISAKRVRMLSGDDLERVLRRRSSVKFEDKLPVIVSPHGMKGRLTGCCPGDLVKHVYCSKNKASSGSLVAGISLSSGCKLRGHSCYAEVSLDFPCVEAERLSQENSSSHIKISRHDGAEKKFSGVNGKGEQKQGSSDHVSFFEKAFIYPAEAVLVPVPQTMLARSSLRRFWFRDFADASLLETGALSDLFRSLPTQCSSSSRNSNSSSCTSSLSTTSSDSECARGNLTSDIEADADSLACKESGLTSSSQCGTDGQTMVSKRAHTDAEPFGQQQPYKAARKGYEFSTKGFPCPDDGSINNEFKPEFSSVEANTASGIVNTTNNHLGTYWHWDDDDAGVVLDVQMLLSEFGDFSDLFENDVLPFGEPPTAAESEAFMFSLVDGADMIGSPTTSGIDVSDQVLLPVLDLPSFEGLNHMPPSVKETNSRNQDTLRDTPSSVTGCCPSLPTTGEFDPLSKSESIMIFAPEYTAVETFETDLSSPLFRNPYVPLTKKVETSSLTFAVHAYGATAPPLNADISDDLVEASGRLREAQPNRDSGTVEITKHYNHVWNRSNKSDNRQSSKGNNVVPCKAEENFSLSSDFKSSDIGLSLLKGGNFVEAGSFIFSLKSILATEVECVMLQASMCRARHALLSFSNLSSLSVNKLGANLDRPSRGTTALLGKVSSKLEPKIASVPMRIAGDIDGGVLDGNHSAPIGVWRPVGAPKGIKPLIAPNNNVVSPSLGAFEEENIASNGQRQSTKVLVDALGLLVQQSASFVDVSLDTDCGDGLYGWLAFQEQRRRRFSCGPYMVHAGCGGLLSSCHSLDIAGVELPDPLSAEVYPSSVISLLQTDMKLALKSAFGDRNIDGPLLVTDWCKGHNQANDGGVFGDGYSAECSMNETRDSPAVSVATGEPISPSQSSTSGHSVLRDGGRLDESNQRRSSQEACVSEMEQQMHHARSRSTIILLPVPSILLGYQDDWLKTSANALQFWEKAPFEPYALPKPVNYYVACPDIDVLTFAASDFFQQLGTVYEACKLGSHTPQTVGSQMGLASGRWSSSGFVPVECPQSVAKAGSGLSLLNSVNEYVMSISRDWDLDSYCNSLCKVLKAIRLGPSLTSPKEGSGVPCTVIYIICPFPSCNAVLRTLIESSAAIGSVIYSYDKDKRSSIHAQVEKALTLSATVDETSVSSIVTLPGFGISKLVLQIVTLEAVLKVNRPPLTEQVTLKEMAFTVYNKARRTQRKVISHSAAQSTTFLNRPQSTIAQLTSPVPGIWKDCVTSRTTGSSLPREGGLDGSLRPGTWDSSWLPSRSVEPNCDLTGQGESASQEEFSYLFEPLFILAEAGSVEHGVPSPLCVNTACESTRGTVDDGNGAYMQMSNSSGSADIGSNSVLDGSDTEMLASSNQKLPSLHCSYGWTEDWRWLVCIWTDSRGELLDSHIFPFGGISSRQDTMGLQQLFIQLLQLGCQICSSSEASGAKPRDIVISRIGCFYELECQEWQKAIFAVGGGEVKKWPLQLRQSVSDGNSASSNGNSLQQQDLSLIQERTLPSSPNPSLYSCHSKSPGYMKSGIPQTSMRKQLLPGPSMMDTSRGALHWVQSISLVGISIDHSLHLILPADTPGSTGPAGSGGNGGPATWGCLEGFGPVRSLESTPSSYLLIPSPCMRFIPPMSMQLPMTLTAESPPLAHLLHSKGFAIPLATGFVVSKAVPSIRRGAMRNSAKDEWPSVLSVSLVDYYGGHCTVHDKAGRTGNISKQPRSVSAEMQDNGSEAHQILERLSAEIHALSWMTVSPAYMERRTALPFHCDMLQRLRRLLHYADKELCQVGKA